MTDAITRSARGEDCQIRYAGICNHNPETVVWAHANGSAAGKGVGLKTPSLLGAYACHACHDLYDGRRPRPQGMTHDDAELDFWRGHARSLVILKGKGLL